MSEEEREEYERHYSPDGEHLEYLMENPMPKEITAWEEKWEKFVLHDCVIAVIASPEVGDKFEPEKYNYANQKLNALNGYIYTKGKAVIQDIIASAVEVREREISEAVNKLQIYEYGEMLDKSEVLDIINPSKE